MTIVSLVKATKAIDQKLNPVFKLQKKKKKLSQTQFQNNRNDFLKAIKDHFNHYHNSIFDHFILLLLFLLFYFLKNDNKKKEKMMMKNK
jgi:predicted PurR-regulated permease PerM